MAASEMAQIKLLVERVADMLPDLRFSEHDLINPSREKLRDFLIASFTELNLNTEDIKGIFGQDFSNPMVPAINIHFIMCKLFLIDEVEVGLFDILSPSSKVMFFIVTRGMTFLESADKHFTRLFTNSEKYTTAKKQLSSINEEIDKVVQAHNVAKMQSQKIQQSLSSDRRKYEDAADKYGEVAKEVQSQAYLLQQTNSKVEYVHAKKQEIKKNTNRLQEKIDQMDCKGDEYFYESLEDDVDTLKAKLETVQNKKEYLDNLIKVKKQTEKRLKQLLKTYNKNTSQFDQFKTLHVKIIQQKEKKAEQYSQAGLKNEVAEAKAALEKVEKEMFLMNEICEAKTLKRMQTDKEHLKAISDQDSIFQKLTIQSRTLGSDLKKMSSVENEDLHTIGQTKSALSSEEAKFRESLARMKSQHELMFKQAREAVADAKENVTDSFGDF